MVTEMVPPPPPGVMVKFVSEISKKMLPTASTLTRAVEVVRLGSGTDSEPSLGVLAASTVGNVVPPSVESEILTFAALTGATAPPIRAMVAMNRIARLMGRWNPPQLGWVCPIAGHDRMDHGTSDRRWSQPPWRGGARQKTQVTPCEFKDANPPVASTATRKYWLVAPTATLPALLRCPCKTSCGLVPSGQPQLSVKFAVRPPNSQINMLIRESRRLCSTPRTSTPDARPPRPIRRS